MKIVNVIPLKKGILKGDLTYFTTKEIESGNLATISLRNKKTLGLVASVENVSDSKIDIKKFGFNLKKILEVKEKSIFLKEYLESVLLASEYFAAGKSSAFASLIPALFREEYDKIVPTALAVADPRSLVGTSRKNIKAEKLLLQEPFENRASIYKTLIRENFSQKKSIYIVMPTEADIELWEEHLMKGIEQFTYTLHSGISSKRMLEKFQAIVSSSHPVLLLGTAPFLSVPRPDLGAVIVEHESSASYPMIAKPHIDMRIFAEIFASKMNATFILSDNFLRFETIARKDLDSLVPMHPLSFRINFNGKIEIKSTKKNKEQPREAFTIFTPETLQEIKQALKNKKNVFIFTLRKGLASQTVCRDCNEVVSCEKCVAPLVLYSAGAEKKSFFVCNRCGEEKDGLAVCSRCQSWNLMPLGIGTETVLEELKRAFPKTPIFKFDKDSVKTKKEAQRIIEEFQVHPGSILIGTEMAMHFLKNKVSLSIVSSFDSFWSIPNFKMSEKIIQLVSSIISLTSDAFIIQTKNPKDPAIRAIESRNIISFVREELATRSKLSYPPFKRFIKIKYTGNKAETLKAKKILAETLGDYNPLIFSGFVAQIKGKYITNALLKVEPAKWSLPQLSLGATIDKELLGKLLGLPESFEIFVDPEDLL